MATTLYEPMLEARARVVIEPRPVDQAARRPTVHARAVMPADRPVPLACRGSAPPSLHGARLTRRGRLVVALAWILLIGAGVLAFVRPWGSPEPAPATVTVQVQAGDTLWELAGDVAPSVDPRETVATILELNGLSSAAAIRPGDALRVPAQG